MAKKKKCECEAGAPLWMVTYGDLMGLLLTFFILLLSFSVIAEDAILKEAIMEFRGSVSILPAELAVVQINPQPQKMRRNNREVEDAARRIQRELQLAGASDVRVQFDETGDIRLSLPSTVLFEPADATLRPEARSVLENLAGVLAEYPEAFYEVEGFTDNLPIATTAQFRDNHDLSYARADAVKRFLSEAGRIPLERFEASAWGPGRPIAPNTTPEGRAANRRVEIYVRGLVSKDSLAEFEQRTQGLTNP